MPIVFPIPPQWMDEAKCATHPDPDLWFRGDISPYNDRQPHRREALEAARWVCADCPCATNCVEYAMTTGSEGVWGGTTTADRKRMKRRARR